jgi:hypothetical protein
VQLRHSHTAIEAAAAVALALTSNESKFEQYNFDDTNKKLWQEQNLKKGKQHLGGKGAFII